MSEMLKWKLKLPLRCSGNLDLPYGFYLYKDINAPWPLVRDDYANGGETQVLADLAAWERDYLDGQKVQSVEWNAEGIPEYVIWLKTVKLAAGSRKDLKKEIDTYIAGGWRMVSDEDEES